MGQISEALVDRFGKLTGQVKRQLAKERISLCFSKGTNDDPSLVAMSSRKGATAARPILELWKGYSEVSGGREDVDGGGLRVDSKEVLH